MNSPVDLSIPTDVTPVMQLSIVIPAWNEEKLLPATLAAIHRAAETSLLPAAIEWEVVVCDNNSTDSTADIARAAGARVVSEPINQIGRARNTGAAAAKGEWILFVDADSQPSSGLLAKMASTMADPGVIGGGSLLRMETRGIGPRLMLKLWEMTSRRLKYAAGSFFFVRADAFRETGGFDTAFFAAEEIDLSVRLKRLGHLRTPRQRMVILTGFPLETSARKLSMHSAASHLGFMLRTVFTRGRTLRQRQACAIWYDGQR